MQITNKGKNKAKQPKKITTIEHPSEWLLYNPADGAMMQ